MTEKDMLANTYLPTRIRKSHLAEKNAQARKMGMTYGQLQAMKYAQEHRLEV